MRIDHERRANDLEFWAWHRIHHALAEGHTGVLSLWTGFVGFFLKGVFILSGFAEFPPADVQFLLRQLPIPLTEHRMAWSLLVGGLIQMFAVGTKGHAIRGTVALFNGSISLLVTAAYLFSGVPSLYQAWISYLGLMLIEGFLAYRNFNEIGRDDTMQHVLRQRRHREELPHGP